MVGMAIPDPTKPPTATGPRELGRATSAQVAAGSARILLVPVGSCEQHGPHLPLDTDTRIAVAVAEAVAARRSDVVVAPAVSYGASGEHQSFPGTLSIGTQVLVSVLVELGRSALPPPGAPQPAPFRSMVLVNGHGGNHEAVRAAVDVLTSEGRAARAWAPTIDGADAHAGRTETSLLLAIAPDVVGPARPSGAAASLSDLLPRMRSGGVASVSENGVLGDAAGASAAEGERLLVDLARQLASALAS